MRNRIEAGELPDSAGGVAPSATADALTDLVGEFVADNHRVFPDAHTVHLDEQVEG